MSLISGLHKRFVNQRRVDRISSLIAGNLGNCRKVLDIGCGDGNISSIVRAKRKGTEITGIEIKVRQPTYIPVIPFDGSDIPFADDFFDAAILVDVLHHTLHPETLLREAKRVSRKCVFIKDHFLYGPVSKYILKQMDRFGNSHADIEQPHNYQTPRQWEKMFANVGLEPELMTTNLGLYAFPFNILFDQNLHFFARLKISDNQ